MEKRQFNRTFMKQARERSDLMQIRGQHQPASKSPAAGQ